MKKITEEFSPEAAIAFGVCREYDLDHPDSIVRHESHDDWSDGDKVDVLTCWLAHLIADPLLLARVHGAIPVDLQDFTFGRYVHGAPANEQPLPSRPHWGLLTTMMLEARFRAMSPPRQIDANTVIPWPEKCSELASDLGAVFGLITKFHEKWGAYPDDVVRSLGAPPECESQP